jgi:hypothetical protein
MTGAQKVTRYHRADTTPVTGAEKVLENRLRRQLQRMGYQLMKSRARDPYDITFGGYQIIDIRTNGLAGGHGNAGRGYAMTLDDVQDWITSMTTGDR